MSSIAERKVAPFRPRPQCGSGATAALACRSRGGHPHRHERPRSRLGSRRLDPLAGALRRFFRPENDAEPCLDLSPYPADARLVLARNPEFLVAGPLGRSAADLAFALDVLAGPRDPLMAAETLVSPRHTLPGGRRVAPWLDEPSAPVDATVAAAMRKAALMLEGGSNRR
jgi:hypothetical protein